MNNDLTVITKRYPEEWSKLRIYAIGDLHVGAQGFNESAVKKKIQIVKDDPNAALVICGDLGDFGLKNSKTNVYQATMQPQEQQEYLYELFQPVKDKISAACPGNHEERLVRETGINPLLTLCCRLGCEDAYRENMAITKYVFGRQSNKQSNVFYGLTTHGTTRNKHKKFIACFDGIDFAVSGHTHTPEYSPHGKIRIERTHGTATHVPYKEIVVDANVEPSGYGLKHEYEIAPPPELQYLELYAYRDNTRLRTLHRVIDFHAVQITD